MITFPPAKINIGLDVLRKRDDGFHAIRSIFYPIPLTDVLEIIPDPANASATFSTSGIAIPGDVADNLCVKAHGILAEHHGIGGVRIHLRKNIPIGAGMGGGSADGTYALRMLDTLFDLNLSSDLLHRYAMELGSDCPFFLQDDAMLVSGRGEHMEPHPLNLQGKHLVLVMPDFGVSTGPAYGSISPQETPDRLSDLHTHSVETWQDRAVNHFESGDLEAYRKVAKIKDELLAAGAFYASMTGSGAAVFGLFESESQVSINSAKAQVFHRAL